MVHRWKGRILFAFADQGLFSASNFILTMLYAAWLPIDDVRPLRRRMDGVALHRGDSDLADRSTRCRRSQAATAGRNRQRIDVAATWVVVGFSVASSLLLLGAAALVATFLPNYAGPLLGSRLVNPLQRLYLFFRRLCYIRDRQAVAAAAAAGLLSDLVRRRIGARLFR